MFCQYIYKNTSFKPKGTVCGRRLKSSDSIYCWQHKSNHQKQKQYQKKSVSFNYKIPCPQKKKLEQNQLLLYQKKSMLLIVLAVQVLINNQFQLTYPHQLYSNLKYYHLYI
jgi:hypothetical protein